MLFSARSGDFEQFRLPTLLRGENKNFGGSRQYENLEIRKQYPDLQCDSNAEEKCDFCDTAS